MEDYDYKDYEYEDYLWEESYDEKPKRKRKFKNDEDRPRKSYLPEAILTIVLYFVAWLLGFFVNWFILHLAHQRRLEEGEIQTYVWLLRAAMWLNFVPLLITILYWVAFIILL